MTYLFSNSFYINTLYLFVPTKNKPNHIRLILKDFYIRSIQSSIGATESLCETMKLTIKPLNLNLNLIITLKITSSYLRNYTGFVAAKQKYNNN